MHSQTWFIIGIILLIIAVFVALTFIFIGFMLLGRAVQKFFRKRREKKSLRRS
ncbi:MAG: hypothetical protein FWE85_01360 [Clostridiales bacterium]|nr:hypothetical protein [Clostridiales bacterium]